MTTFKGSAVRSGERISSHRNLNRENDSLFRSTGLTERQRECLRWASAGKSSTGIAIILRISAGVVDEHIANACKKLGVATRMQAVLSAMERGELDT